MEGFNTKVTPEIERLTQECKDHSSIDLSLYGKYDVKRDVYKRQVISSVASACFYYIFKHIILPYLSHTVLAFL